MSAPHNMWEVTLETIPAAPPEPRRRDFRMVTASLVGGVIAALVATLSGLGTPGALASGLLVSAVTALLLIWRGGPEADCLVLVGHGSMASIIASTLQEHTRGRNGARFRVVRAGSLAEAAALLRWIRCSEVVIADPVHPGENDLLDARRKRPAILTGAEKIEQLLGRVPLELVPGDQVLSRLSEQLVFSQGYALAKRGLDLLVAIGLGLAVLPTLPLIALAIKLDSPGPVFYTQDRVGLGGRIFRIYKFRTMRRDAERHGAVWASERDPRVTRIGRFLRLTRVDEIPQLWNVIRGDMTLVGPRPERPEFTADLARTLPGYDKRHVVKPGLTGWAQVCYRYASSVRDTKIKVEYDLYYIKHASLWLDMKILWRTIGVVLGMRGR
jgi:exopolysaccharide biosynthesis polyprenyl glycosylphosphotransferase